MKAAGSSTDPLMKNTLLLCSFVLLVAGVASAQTSRTQSPSAGTRPTPASIGPDQDKPIRATPDRGATGKAPSIATNSPAEPVENFLQAEPGRARRELVLEAPIDEPKANELTLGHHSYSGIAVQILKAKKRLQPLNPAAPSDYGSGWDNIERFPASVSILSLKVFSISF